MSQTAAAHDRYVSDCVTHNWVPRRARLPWERPSWASLAMGIPWNEASLYNSFMPIRTVAPKPAARPKKQLPVAYQKVHVVKRRRLFHNIAERCPDEERALAIQKWLAIVEVNLAASKLGRDIMLVQVEEDAEDQIREMIEDVLGAKAAGTMMGRSSAILLFMAWHQEQGYEDDALPLMETKVEEV